MADARDLSDLLPPSPPARPERREAAIGAALRRFDGAGDTPARAARPARRWGVAGKPQLGVLVAAALVATIGLPLWLSGEHRPPIASHESAPTVATTNDAVLADTVSEPPPEPQPGRAPSIVAPRETADVPTPDAPAAVVATAPVRPSAPTSALAEPAAPPPPPPPPPPPAPIVAREAPAAMAGEDIVVTSARVADRAGRQRQRKLAQRGDWNRCTIDDPRRDANACRPRAARPAESLVADGLAAAWRGDREGAIAAFDKALAVAPGLGAAWLNRGLAHAEDGDDARALADLDRAVRVAPRDARGWFQRSLILRRQGKTARADADAARAIELDPRYEDLID